MQYRVRAISVGTLGNEAPNKAPPGLRVPSSEFSPSLVRVPSKEERKTDQTVAVPSSE